MIKLIVLVILMIPYFMANNRIQECISNSRIHKPSDYLVFAYKMSCDVVAGFILGYLYVIDNI